MSAEIRAAMDALMLDLFKRIDPLKCEGMKHAFIDYECLPGS